MNWNFAGNEDQTLIPTSNFILNLSKCFSYQETKAMITFTLETLILLLPLCFLRCITCKWLHTHTTISMSVFQMSDKSVTLMRSSLSYFYLRIHFSPLTKIIKIDSSKDYQKKLQVPYIFNGLQWTEGTLVSTKCYGLYTDLSAKAQTALCTICFCTYPFTWLLSDWGYVANVSLRNFEENPSLQNEKPLHYVYYC